MINFKVIRINDIAKNLVKLLILLIVIILFTRFFYALKSIDLQTFIENKKKSIENKTFLELLDENLEQEVTEEIEEKNLISQELSFIEGESLVEADIQTSETVEELDEENIQDDAQKNVTTQVVQENNKTDTYNVTYGTVQIKNQTSFELTQEMLTPDVDMDLTNILIYHTHTSESYTPTENYTYEASGNFRTLDTSCSVVRVGEELKTRLNNKGINVIHDETFHDYPEYNGSYSRSLQTVQNDLSQTSCDFVIDLHRDALADSTYGPSVMIGDEKAAQLMFVMGSSEGGLSHPNWNTNLKIAIKIQEKANEMYPGLFKPIMLSKYRYNQHLAKGSCIIEVGATGNTMEECLVSMKYLAEVIEAIKEEE